ncbi:hypothetical protein DFH28DRAFT_921239 [Melampsora americana]|nr:hypothetical protein DFH28DRAFT_923261 [Melampsora americana]KAH9825290.1 hypothetical protein DFH28DRAFT_921239 [Melampsora americana]
MLNITFERINCTKESGLPVLCTFAKPCPPVMEGLSAGNDTQHFAQKPEHHIFEFSGCVGIQRTQKFVHLQIPCRLHKKDSVTPGCEQIVITGKEQTVLIITCYHTLDREDAPTLQDYAVICSSGFGQHDGTEYWATLPLMMTSTFLWKARVALTNRFLNLHATLGLCQCTNINALLQKSYTVISE